MRPDDEERFARFLRFEEWERSQGRAGPQRAPALAERTVGELHAEWLQTLGGVARKNRTSQGRHLKSPFWHQGIEYVLADLKPSECSPALLEAWQAMLLRTASVLHWGKNIEPGTVHQIRMGIQSMWKHYIDAEVLPPGNPWHRAKKVKGRDRLRQSYATYQDTERYAEAMPLIGGFVVRHAFATGLRIVNQLRLLKTQVDYAAGGVHVVQKGGKEHFAPVDPKTLKEMRDLAEVSPGPYLYPNPLKPHEPISYNTFLGWTRRARKKLGKHVVPHDLRHGCAMDMMEHGADITEVKEQLGHSDIKLSSRYARLRGAAVKRLHDRQAKRFAGR